MAGSLSAVAMSSSPLDTCSALFRAVRLVLARRRPYRSCGVLTPLSVPLLPRAARSHRGFRVSGRGALDRLRDPAGADHVPEVARRVPGEHDITHGPGGGRAPQAEQRSELTEVPAGVAQGPQPPGPR